MPASPLPNHQLAAHTRPERCTLMTLTVVATPDPARRLAGRIVIDPLSPPAGIRRPRQPGSMLKAQLANPARSKR